MAWCLQCGVKHELNAAVGVDEDGEPACRMHAMKSDVKSAVQPEKSKPMATESKGLRPKGNCTVCGKSVALFQMGKHMARKHGQESQGAIAVPAKPVGPMQTSEGQSIEPEVTVHLKQSQVSKLLQLLL